MGFHHQFKHKRKNDIQASRVALAAPLLRSQTQTFCWSLWPLNSTAGAGLAYISVLFSTPCFSHWAHCADMQNSDMQPHRLLGRGEPWTPKSPLLITAVHTCTPTACWSLVWPVHRIRDFIPSKTLLSFRTDMKILCCHPVLNRGYQLNLALLGCR